MDYIPFCDRVTDLDFCVRSTEYDFFEQIDEYIKLNKNDLENAMVNDLRLHIYHQWKIKPLTYVKMMYKVLDDSDIEQRTEPHKLEMIMRTLSD